MRRLLRTALPLVLLLSTPVGALEIEVGGQPIEIPIPTGYAELTPEMSPTYGAMYAYVVPTQERYMVLIPSEAAEAYLRGKDLDYDRYMMVEADRQAARFDITQSDFDELRDSMRGQIDDLYDSLREEFPAVSEGASESLSDTFDVDIEMSVGEIIPMEPHLDTDDIFALSQIVNVGIAIDGEELESEVGLATIAFIKVRRKMIAIMVYGGEDDLEWTREFATDWASQILAENPPLADSSPDLTRGAVLQSENELDVPQQRGFDWRRVLIAAVIGGLIGILGFAVSRRRKDQT